MITTLSLNTQAILLLTAPLLIGANSPAADVLTPKEYRQLAQLLKTNGYQPGDLLTGQITDVSAVLADQLNCDRLHTLLARGFQLSQAVERWHSRALWVISRADAAYPQQLKTRLQEHAPAILYGCGDHRLLTGSGLAVVGSRHVNDELIAYTEQIGQLTAQAGQTLISGGARGIDQAAMRGALTAGGGVIGVVADHLEQAALNSDNRHLLLDNQLLLLSPYDPAVGFNVGNAMQRNKLIYALATAALVIQSDYKTGGTWAGATEQLNKYRAIPIYVRVSDEPVLGLQALEQLGALPWPNPATPEELTAVLLQCDTPLPSEPITVMTDAPNVIQHPAPVTIEKTSPPAPVAIDPLVTVNAADELFATVRRLITAMTTPQTDVEIAQALNVSKVQIKQWLERLVAEGVLIKLTRPVRYQSAMHIVRAQQPRLLLDQCHHS